MDLERVICPLHDLPDPGAKGFTMGAGDWPLRVERGYVMLDDGVSLEEPPDLGR